MMIDMYIKILEKEVSIFFRKLIFENKTANTRTDPSHTIIDCLKFSLKALKNVLIVPIWLPFAIRRVQWCKAVREGPIVTSGILHKMNSRLEMTMAPILFKAILKKLFSLNKPPIIKSFLNLSKSWKWLCLSDRFTVPLQCGGSWTGTNNVLILPWMFKKIKEIVQKYRKMLKIAGKWKKKNVTKQSSLFYFTWSKQQFTYKN